jgi:hypothetical protein
MSKEIAPDELTATLLRRIAHAVDGNRRGWMLYVVVDIDLPCRVKKMFAFDPSVPGAQADAEAKAEATCTDETLRWAGPYQTYAQPEDPPHIIECHEFDSDWCEEALVTGATMNYTDSPLPKPTDVKELTVSWKSVNGIANGRQIFRWEHYCTDEELLEDYEENELEAVKADLKQVMVDSLFFTQAASDKFLYPYIARVHGVRTAFEQRGRLQLGVKDIWQRLKNVGMDPNQLSKADRVVNKCDKGRGLAALVVEGGGSKQALL